ncbi:MAG TPA: hypothetical protein PLU35_14145, partial [Phycisphaerales bacterium]|nr:hypothetical protein [Phycisphaerales bacterium]
MERAWLRVFDGEEVEQACGGRACVCEDALLAEFGLLGEGVEELLGVRVAEPGDEPLRGEVVHGGQVDEGIAAGEIVVDEVGDVDVRGQQGGGGYLRPFGALETGG